MYDSFLALGDSFTEGLDDLRPDGTYRGWADMVAAELAARNPVFRYANLAVRGRRLAQIAEQQLPSAEQMKPALVSIAAGGNDIIGLRCDVGQLSDSMHLVLQRLTETGATVLVFTGFNPRGRLPMGRVLAGRAERYNASIVTAADELGARVVDLWTLDELYEHPRWAADRLHLSGSGHALVAEAVLRELGEESAAAFESQAGLPEQQRPWITARRADAGWAWTHLAPWVGRQLRGRSAGDSVQPKHPDLIVLPERRQSGTTSASVAVDADTTCKR
jgi:lysophospholipase L1-like esterase